MKENSSAINKKFFDLDTLWDARRPAVAEAEYVALLGEATHLPEGERHHLAELLTLIARAQGAQGKLPEARLNLAEAEKILATLEPPFQAKVNIRCLMEEGRLFVAEKTPSRARVLLSQAWSLAVNSEDDYATIDIARLMAEIEPPKLQEEWISKAIQIAEESTQPRAQRWLGNLYASLAWKQFGLLQYETALATFQKSLGLYEAEKAEHEIFKTKWSVGKLLRKMGRLEEALALQKGLLSELGFSGGADGRLYEEIAECLQALQKTAEAQPYFELAHKELSSEQWVSDNQPVKLKRLKDLGKVRGSSS